MAYSAATRAFKAINSAMDDIEKRRKKEGESFTYEPWAVPSEEEQSIRAAQVNQRYADIAQNGPDAAAIAGREAMKNLQAQQKYLQYQREMEEQRNNRLLQNGFTQGDIDASNMYRNASTAQKSALENIYTAQSMTPSGGDRYSGYTTSDYMANQFKKDNSVDDEAYKNLMAGYKAYRAQQALAAQDSYSGITDEQKKELSRIGETQSTGGILNGITGKTKQSQQEAQSLTDQFKKKYGVDDATYSAWQGMNDQEQAEKEAEEEASKSGKRTYSQELDYAENMFKAKGKSNSDSLRADISKYSSMVSEAKMQRSSGLAESASNIQTDFGEQAQKDADSFRESLKKKYALSDNDIDDLVYYGQELDDYSNRQQQKQEAYNNVHQDSTAKNILGGIKNTATALTLNPYAGIGAIGETAKYYGGGYRDKKSPMNVNSVAFGASNATTDYQSTTQEALNNKSKVLGTLYGAGMSAAESAETGTLGGAVNGTGLGARVARSALSLAPFGANAYASSISQNVADKNQSQGKAMANALASASVEVATEIASADKFWDIFKNHNATARKKIIDFLVSSGIEGTEEVVGDIADNFIDAALNGKNSEYNQSVRDYMKLGMSAENAKRQATKDTLSDTANSFVTGALSGAMGAGIATASGYANDAYNSKTMFDGYTKEDYAQWAEGLDTDPTHYKNASTAQSAEMAKSLAKKMAQEDNATPRQKRELYEYYQDMHNTEMEAATESEEKEKRKDKIEGIKNKVGSFFGRNEATEGQQAAEQTNTTESADTQKTAMVEPQNVPEEHRTQSTDIAPNDAYAKMAAAQNGEELRNAYQEAVHSTNEETREHADSDLQIVSGMLQKRGISAEEIESAKISTEDAYAAGYSGQEISENVPAAVKIAYNDGQKQAIEDRAQQTLEARDSVKRTAAKQLTDSARKFIESGYKDGMNAAAYNTVIPAAINAGRTGVTFEEYSKKNGASLQLVDDGLAKRAYEVGQQIAIEDLSKETARAMAERNGVKEFGTGTFIDSRTDKSGSISGARVMKAVARMTGLNIVFTDNGFDGKTNGYYNPENSTIYLNSDMADRVASTLSHEGIGEFSAVWNPDEYAKVVKDIMQASQEIYGTAEFNRERQKYVDAYSKEKGKTDADVDKEMANDVLYQLVGTEKGVKKLLEQIDQNHSHEEAKSIKQKLADWVHKMVESIKNLLDEFRPNSYQRKMAEANLDRFEKLQDEVIHSFAGAINNYSAAKAQSQQNVATDESANVEGNSVDVDSDTKRMSKQIQGENGEILYGGKAVGIEDESSGERRFSLNTYEHGGKQYLEDFLNNTDDLTDAQKEDILTHMEFAYNLAKDLSKNNQFTYFGQWSKTGLAKTDSGVPLLEVRSGSDGKPIRSVAVNNGEYPLNIDFSQVCKKRSTLNAVLNYMVKNYGMNLRTLTASDVININQAIKNHGFEIACGLCFVDAKRYRTGAWASTFAEGTKNKKGELNANQPGYNNLVRMIVPKDKSNDVGYSYFNFATDIPSASARTIDQLSDDELDFTKIEKKLGRYAKYDEDGNIVGISGYRDKSGRTKNPTETIRLAWAIYSNPEMRHLISEEDLISSDGLDAMRDQNGQLYSLVNAHWGAGKPKLSHGGTAYGNEILRSAEWGAKNDFNPESAAKVGGVRVQSFSDYEANMFFDYMQLFADMSARKLTSHAYTKEPYYAKLFGMTGQKINLSIVAKAAELTEEQQARYEKLVNKGDKYLLNDPEFKEIAEHAGLAKDKNGNWTVPLVEDETFPLQEALALQKDPRYSSNCGIIWIGISDAQIRVLLDSDDVPMVIPYHSSGVSRIVKKERNLLLYKDYTNQQNTRTKDGKKITGKDFDFYGSLAKTNDVIKTTEEYKAWCEKNGYLPKFDTFKDHPNYYKLLIDFRAYDYNGIDPEKMAHRKYQPQGIVQMKFPDNLAELVAESLAEQQETKDLEAKEFTDAQGSLLNDVKEILGLGDVRSSKNIDEDVDIRRDIGIDDYVTDQELWSDHYDTKKSLIEVLRSGNEILKHSDIDKTAVRRIAREIKEQYHSNIDVNELAENLAKVFRYAQGQNYIDYDDLATVISEVASPVIDGSVTKVGAEEFNQFKTALQGATYNLDSKQEAEVVSAFGSWGNFRKAIPGVKFTRDGSGVSLDGVWSTLVQETGYVLDMDTSSNDMPLALVDAYNSMKPEYQNAFGEDATQAAQDVAMEIVARYYQYSAGQEKLKLKAKQKQELLDQARRMAASNAAYRKKIKQEYQKRYEEELSKVRRSGGRSETVSKQVARLRAKNARTVASIREQQKRKDELRMLKTPVKSLMDMLTGPTDKKHVPALVQTPVLQLASAFDFVPQTVRETADGKFSIRILESRDINADGSYSYKWRTIHADSRADAIAQYKKAMEENGLGSAENKSWQESLRAIQDLYQQDEGDDWFERSELKQGLDKELGEKLGEILRKNQGTISIAQLSSDELKTLNAVVRNVLHSINQMNRMYSQPSKHVSDIAHMAMDRTTSGVKGRREHFKPVATLVDTLTLDHASPETYFHGIFGGENTDPVTKTLIGAQNKKARDIRQASEYMKGVRDKVGVKPKDLEGWMKETKNYYGLNLTTTQIMSLYELSKRPDAQQHKIGGFVADESNREKISGQRIPVHLTNEQIKEITDTLTPQQKQMADAMQYYLAHQCAEQGNETCMQLYGYEKFVDEHYFPMTTDKNTIATRDSNVTQGAINAIKNSGFTKDITPNASNPLVLRDIFAVYSDHVAQMATYHAWAAPIQDIIRFFNYSEKTDVKVDGQTFTGRNSVKDAIDFFYGKSGQEYFVKLLSSINDREKSSFVGGDFYDLMTGHAKTAAVMGNLRVVIQQPTAIFRAGEMISYKYLNEGMAGKYRKEAAELRDRTSDVFWLKNQGNIDGYITQSLVSTITGVKTTREKINDFAGNPASKADEITWAAMYRAVYAEQVDKLGKGEIGTKEFEDAVNERFSEVVLRTQVYDGTITRSQFMRSPDTKNRMMSAFMAEPVKTYNMILRDMIDISQATDERQVKKAVAHLVRITAPVLLITNAVNAVAQSFVDALRSEGDPDDDDKDFLRLFMDALGFGNWLDEDASFNDKAWEFLSGNLVDGMDLLSNIPMVAQYWDATKEGVKSVLGESTYSSDSDLSMSGVKNFFKAVKAIVNPSEKMTTYGKVAALTRAFSDLSGYPLYAAQRDVVAIYNTVASQIFKQLPVLQKATKYTPKKQAKLDVYTAALESGGDYKKAIEDAVAQGNDYKAISKGISDSYKDTYLALKETNPNEAIKMKNRLVTLYVYLSDKAGTNKDKTTSEKTKYYSDNIDKWK